ncbi:MAG: YbjN domain-containing protein, partial [Candidatus Methanomethylophilaceae archaeon]
DDLPISISISIDDISIRFICYLDLKAKEERYREVTWELNDINRHLIFGAFFLDPDDGMISFEYSYPYIEADVSQGFILGFMKMLANTVDRYDGDLKKLAESVPHSDSVKNSMYG